LEVEKREKKRREENGKRGEICEEEHLSGRF
jgi:hypothetical protein